MQEKPTKWTSYGIVLVLVAFAAITFLLASGFEYNPLLKAAKSGDLAQVKRLTAEKRNLIHSRTLIGDTPLILAVKSGNSKVVSVLIEAGADVNAKGGSKTTALHWAAFYGSVSSAEMLLKAALM